MVHRQNYLEGFLQIAFPSQEFQCFLFPGRQPEPHLPLAAGPSLAQSKISFPQQSSSHLLEPACPGKRGKTDPHREARPHYSAAWVFLKVKLTWQTLRYQSGVCVWEGGTYMN